MCCQGKGQEKACPPGSDLSETLTTLLFQGGHGHRCQRIPLGEPWGWAVGNKDEKSGRGGERSGEARQGPGESGKKEVSQEMVKIHEGSPAHNPGEGAGGTHGGSAPGRWKAGRERIWGPRLIAPMAVGSPLPE